MKRTVTSTHVIIALVGLSILAGAGRIKGSTASSLSSKLKTSLSKAGASIKKAGQTLKSKASAAGQTVKAKLSAAGTKLSAAGQKLKANAKTLGQKIKTSASNTKTKLSAAGQKLKAGLKKAGAGLKKAGAGLKTAGAALGEHLKKVDLGELREKVSAVSSAALAAADVVVQLKGSDADKKRLLEAKAAISLAQGDTEGAAQAAADLQTIKDAEKEKEEEARAKKEEADQLQHELDAAKVAESIDLMGEGEEHHEEGEQQEGEMTEEAVTE
jgi:hypothetical protein